MHDGGCDVICWYKPDPGVVGRDRVHDDCRAHERPVRVAGADRTRAGTSADSRASVRGGAPAQSAFGD